MQRPQNRKTMINRLPRRGLALGIALCAMALVSSWGCTSWQEYFQNGFKVGPNYRPPCAPVEDRWIDAGKPGVVSAAPDRDNWWTVFNDQTLNELIVVAYRQNPSLKLAAWRIQQARALRGIAVGALFPQQQDLTASYSRNAVSQTVRNQVHNTPFFNEEKIAPGLSWEVDFWGLYRRGVEAADANLDASVDGYNNALVLLLSEVANSYIELRTADLRLAYAYENLKAQKSILDMARQRFNAGATSELDVSQAIAHVEHTNSLIPPLRIQRRQAANQLCILMGIPPKDINDMLRGVQPIPTAPSQVAIGIPCDLLRQRPDVRQAERNCAAQSARIGIATAALYPHLSILGTIGYDSSDLSQWIEPKSLAGSVGPSFRWDILKYGVLVDGIQVQDALFQQLAFQYQSTVLQAYDEAENALIGFLQTQLQRKSLAASVTAGKRSLELAISQYREGSVNFNWVDTMATELAQEEDQLAVAQGAVPLDLVQLYKALGGGWHTVPVSVDAPSPLPPRTETVPLPPAEPLPAAPSQSR
jgi:NodT family efflux transporter outer membrane factor (OMF) lipoprotein